MKKHLFTAVLAIVAIGGVFAMNANTNQTKKVDAITYYKSNVPVCNDPVTCDTEILGPACSTLGTLYNATDCSFEPAPQGNYQP